MYNFGRIFNGQNMIYFLIMEIICPNILPAYREERVGIKLTNDPISAQSVALRGFM